MGCGSCSSGGGCTPNGCKSNGNCATGCGSMEVHDWLSNLDMPANYRPFLVTEVKFKGSRKEFFVNQENIYLEIGELVAVEGSSGGFDVGNVSLTGELVRVQMQRRKTTMDAVIKKIYRKATEADVEKWNAAKELEWEAMHRGRKLALDLGLSMKISDVDYQADKSKATFYYTADGRVDFRELIKKMAEQFRVRIEMRQIGMRQEAGRLGGIGSCGRELCCSTWLTNFKTVSTAAARYQNLSLNTLKLAGQCGKLKCCLNYELDTYLDALKDIPDRVDSLDTVVGYARHQKTDIFKKIMWFSYQGEDDWIPLTAAKVKEILALNKAGKKGPNLKEEAIVIAAPEVLEKSYDYENVVGQDSLTRLDDRSKNKNKARNSRPKGKPHPVNKAGEVEEAGGKKDATAGQGNDRGKRENRTPNQLDNVKGDERENLTQSTEARPKRPRPKNKRLPDQTKADPSGLPTSTPNPIADAASLASGDDKTAPKNKNRNNRKKNFKRRNENNGPDQNPSTAE
ncbi:cell fate regulator YaaT (PSP1 superfamily) [Pedobacter sp. UYP30]|uniref:PSP1 domain-containing protein n=1 Tax=Pedobacter sp. UYP30 TaxID=1756400 RepID=UPI003393C3BD